MYTLRIRVVSVMQDFYLTFVDLGDNNKQRIRQLKENYPTSNKNSLLCLFLAMNKRHLLFFGMFEDKETFDF